MLESLPLVFVLAGLALYMVLGGADFGAGFWQLFAGRGPRAEQVREHAHHSMAPVWEANHVWLIFVLTVFWTSYPKAFGSIASTLGAALFVAAIGIVFRGAAYALRAGAQGARESALIDTVFSLSSILAPFALGAAIGAIATDRVPVGNAAGAAVRELAEPDLDLHRRARGRQLRLPGRRLPRRRRRTRGSGRPRARIPPARARCGRGGRTDRVRGRLRRQCRPARACSSRC